MLQLATMTADVLAHVALGVASLGLAGLTIAEAKSWLSKSTSSLIFGLVVLAAGLFYYLLLSGFSVPVNPLNLPVDATSRQHFMIASLLVLSGLLAITVRQFRPHCLIRVASMALIGMILFSHTQSHGDDHGSVGWLVPYHRVLAVLLFIGAACYLLLALSPKRQYLRSVVPVCLAVIGLMLVLYRDPVAAKSPCLTQPRVIQARIIQDRFEPKIIQAKRCDKIRFVTNDSKEHIIAIGSHPQHIHYQGWTEQSIKNGVTAELTLAESGRFKIHDHLNEQISALLVVSE